MRLEGLDALRGIAAIAVLICHIYFITDLPMPPGFRTTAGNFALAVEMFFMLSAFSMCVGYFGRLGDLPGLAQYGRRRLLRIVPLFYFFIVVWSVYRYVHGSMIPMDDLMVAATFTFGLFPKFYGGYIAVGWSIGVEMIFYALFPIIVLVVRDLRSSLIAFALSVVVAAVGHEVIVASGINNAFVRANTIVQLPMFAAGIVCFFIYRQSRLGAFFAVTAMALTAVYWTVLFLVIGNPPGVHAGISFWWRAAICLPFPLLLLAFAAAPFQALVNRVTITLGAYSYGIYLWHSLVIVETANVRRVWFAPDAVGGIWSSFALSCVAVTALTVLAAACTYHLIEMPFQALGKLRRPVSAE